MLFYSRYGMLKVRYETLIQNPNLSQAISLADIGDIVFPGCPDWYESHRPACDRERDR